MSIPSNWSCIRLIWWKGSGWTNSVVNATLRYLLLHLIVNDITWMVKVRGGSRKTNITPEWQRAVYKLY